MDAPPQTRRPQPHHSPRFQVRSSCVVRGSSIRFRQRLCRSERLCGQRVVSPLSQSGCFAVWLLKRLHSVPTSPRPFSGRCGCDGDADVCSVPRRHGERRVSAGVAMLCSVQRHHPAMSLRPAVVSRYFACTFVHLFVLSLAAVVPLVRSLAAAIARYLGTTDFRDLFACLAKDPTVALLCTHTYHVECMNAYCSARNMTIHEIPCPQCKRSGNVVDDGGLVPSDEEPDALPSSPDIILMAYPKISQPSQPSQPSELGPEAIPPPMVVPDLMPPPPHADDSATLMEESAENNTLIDELLEAAPPAKGKSKAVAKRKAKAKAKAVAKADQTDGDVPMPDAAAEMGESVRPPPKRKAKAKSVAVEFEGTEPPPKAKAKAVVAEAGPPPKRKAKAKAKAKAVAAEAKAKAVAAEVGVEDPEPQDAAAKAAAAQADVVAETAIVLARSSTMSTPAVQLCQGLALCDSCNRYQAFDSVRVRSKSAGSFRCTSCHSKQCTLRRAFGRWPTEAFAAMDKEAQLVFWSSLTNLPGPAMVAKVTDSLETFEESAESFYDGGEFLPLSVSFSELIFRK